ncbi:MAG: Uma2 family endonuclease [Verrucomicrobiales bacterium]
MSSLALRYEPRLTVDEYLEWEEHQELKYDYCDGVVTVRAAVSQNHELVAVNFTVALSNHLRGKGCRVYKSDVKLRIRLLNRDLFYYPDVMVGCDPDDTHPFYIEKPKLIVEVLSADENKDRVEKYFAYQRIPALEEYVIVSQNPEQPEVSIYRRAEGWEPGETHTKGEFTLKSVGLTLSVGQLYVG